MLRISRARLAEMRMRGRLGQRHTKVSSIRSRARTSRRSPPRCPHSESYVAHGLTALSIARFHLIALAARWHMHVSATAFYACHDGAVGAESVQPLQRDP